MKENPETRMRWDAELYEARHSFVWQLGSDLVTELDPKAGERILDLGCGTGQLSFDIAQRGAVVVGLDQSLDMIGQARQNFPSVRFVLGRGETMAYRAEFDAVFSNATLHWIKDAGTVAARISEALKPGGRFVTEFGGRGNIASIERALCDVLMERAIEVPPSPWFFPSIAEYSALLEAEHLEVQTARLITRPTTLEGEDGMERWLQQFAAPYLDRLSPSDRASVLEQTVERLQPVAFRQGRWWADYRRLRVAAVRLPA